jgi:CTD small phosphatase-like protein 2
VKLHQGVYAKDLRIINRDISQMLLVDNSPFSYLYQPENGVPILPFAGEADSELLGLEKYLESARKENDVRELNKRTFQLHRYKDFSNCDELVRELYLHNSY